MELSLSSPSRSRLFRKAPAGKMLQKLLCFPFRATLCHLFRHEEVDTDNRRAEGVQWNFSKLTHSAVEATEAGDVEEVGKSRLSLFFADCSSISPSSTKLQSSFNFVH
jgi:hypothetical protein